MVNNFKESYPSSFDYYLQKFDDYNFNNLCSNTMEFL